MIRRKSDKRVYLYDSTLRDGQQTQGVDFDVSDKVAIAEELDRLGIDYIEGGWPGANPTDDTFFTKPPRLRNARLAAFGMTRRLGRSVENDPGMAGLLSSGAKVVCLVGKTWDFHVKVALKATFEENLKMIRQSVTYANERVAEVLFDAEHFFDGFKANPEYALACIRAAHEAGARWVVLCDTNGGTLPHEVEAIVAAIAKEVPGERLGIHCHNDTENAVANSLAAVRAGARQVQGTMNGLGERCGNTNLVSLLPTLMLKMGYTTGVSEKNLRQLTHVSRLIDDRLNRIPNHHAPYVGVSAFAHKGGLHVSAVAKDPKTYEHIDPERVGNHRHVVVSDQAGKANVLARLDEIGVKLKADDPRLSALIEKVKMREYEGYSYDVAGASFELLARRALGKVPEYFRLNNFRVIDERRWNAKGELVTLSEAKINVSVGGKNTLTVAEGNGPVNALDNALRQALVPIYRQLGKLRLVDYKVRILDSSFGTEARTRVMIESAAGKGDHWTTVGVSTNVIDASYNALHDSITYLLFRAGAKV
ncbi:MAG: citramalate synthase [Pseudomonadota bacterium]